MNRLYFGDCLTIMQDMPLGHADLIYLDPPFKSQKDYNAIYEDETGRRLPDQIDAFGDTWVLNEKTERAARDMPVLMREAGVEDEVAEFWRLWMNALRKTNPRVLAYLVYMTQRLLPMRGILKPTGSLYLHCDPSASHYIKVMLDAIFGHDNFINEIVWQRTSSHSDAKMLGSVHGIILHYAKNVRHVTHNKQHVPYDPEYVEQRYKGRDSDGRRWMDGDLTAKGLSAGGYTYEFKGTVAEWRVPLDRMKELDRENRLYFTNRGGIRIKRYLDEMKGLPLSDVWTDIPPVNSRARERLGYATQKPVTLLERIIQSSSNPGDTVFDPFCGCATTIEAAHRLDRRWIGIDIAIHAIKRVASLRLRDRLGLKEGEHFIIDGVPRNLEGAQDLWEGDKYQFQRWAVEQVDGFVTTRKGCDGGIDGRLYFDLPDKRDLQSMVLEVKGGASVGIDVVRNLRGVLEREGAQMAGLIIMGELGERKTRNFLAEMARAGDLDVLGVKYARMQMLTVQEIFSGKRFLTPSVARGKGGWPSPACLSIEFHENLGKEKTMNALTPPPIWGISHETTSNDARRRAGDNRDRHSLQCPDDRV